MRQVKKYLMLSTWLYIYMAALSLLFGSFVVYQKGYQNLSRLMAHPSIAIDNKTDGEN